MNSSIPSSSIGKPTPSSLNSGHSSITIKPSLKSTDEGKQEGPTPQLTSTTKTLFGQTTANSDFTARVAGAIGSTVLGGVTGGVAGAGAAGMSQAMAMQSGMMKANLMREAASGISELGSLGKIFKGKGEEEESQRKISSRNSWGKAGARDA